MILKDKLCPVQTTVTDGDGYYDVFCDTHCQWFMQATKRCVIMDIAVSLSKIAERLLMK